MKRISFTNSCASQLMNRYGLGTYSSCTLGRVTFGQYIARGCASIKSRIRNSHARLTGGWDNLQKIPQLQSSISVRSVNHQRSWVKRRFIGWLVGLSCALCLGIDVIYAANMADDTSTTNVLSTAQTNHHAQPYLQTAEPTQTPRAREFLPRNRDAVVVFGRNVILKSNESADAIVVIGGSAKVYGTVREAIVTIGGNILVDGNVGEAVVAVLGNVQLSTNATVGQDVVAVFGDVAIDNNAAISGNVAVVGGKLEIADNAHIGGQIQEVDLGKFGLPNLAWLQTWMKQCVLKLRPLAPQVGWVWIIWGLFLLLYLLIALAFPRLVGACVEELMHRPATTFAVGLLTILLLPFVLVLLLVTAIGVFVIPFLWVVLVLACIVGRVALLEYFGKQFGRNFRLTILEKPVLALFVGALILTVLYIIPVLGLIVLGLTGIWAVGTAILAMFTGLRRETHPQQVLPGRTVVPPAEEVVTGVLPGAIATTQPTQPTTATIGTISKSQQPGFGTGQVGLGTTPGQAQATQPTQPALEPPQTFVPDAFRFVRAGFWDRLAAAFLDIVLVGVISGVLGGGKFGLIIALAYFAGMWTWRSTTIGGVLLNLKVVRLDGRRITFGVALVRALVSVFSVIVFFLGFLWIAWDKEKQAWHDKIVGTVVVRLPHTKPLLSV